MCIRDSLRKKYNIKAVYKLVDTCAGGVAAKQPYFYSTYEVFDESRPSKNKKVVILGLSLIHISEPTRLLSISYAVFCLKKKKKKHKTEEKQKEEQEGRKKTVAQQTN